MTTPSRRETEMYKVVLVLSITFWAFAIATLISKPKDVRRTLHLLRTAKPTPKPPPAHTPKTSMPAPSHTPTRNPRYGT
jgi:hypothetical protein